MRTDNFGTLLESQKAIRDMEPNDIVSRRCISGLILTHMSPYTKDTAARYMGTTNSVRGRIHILITRSHRKPSSASTNDPPLIPPAIISPEGRHEDSLIMRLSRPCGTKISPKMMKLSTQCSRCPTSIPINLSNSMILHLLATLRVRVCSHLKSYPRSMHHHILALGLGLALRLLSASRHSLAAVTKFK